MSQPPASILIPTRGRPAYLEVTLSSVAPQAAAAGAELLVIDDGGIPDSVVTAQRHGARVLSLRPSRGANAARNAGVAAARSDLVVLIDDDVRAPEGWLAELLAGVERAPEHDVFGGPIRAVLEGGGPHACGREGAPITTLDLGPVDCDAKVVWSANMALRRRAFQTVGPFDETIRIRGDEEDWERRYRAGGGRIRYIAAAGLEHRRTRDDARLRPLMNAAYAQGRAARRYDAHRGMAPKPASEIRVLVGSIWHIARRRCANGFVLTAQAAGRLREALER